MLIGIDIGGTTVKLAAYTAEGLRIAEGSVTTPVIDEAGSALIAGAAEAMARAAAGDDAVQVTNKLQTADVASAQDAAEPEAAAESQAVRQTADLRCEGGAADAPEVIGVGVGIPGAVDSRGRVTMIPNVSLDADALRAALAKTFPSAVLAFLNDANAAALGEQWIGAGAGRENLVMVTLGTGVGAGIVVGGRVLAGSHGAAGEIGHLCVCAGGRPCNCGCRGCLEQYASATALTRRANEEAPGAFADAKAVFDALAGEPAPEPRAYQVDEPAGSRADVQAADQAHSGLQIAGSAADRACSGSQTAHPAADQALSRLQTAYPAAVRKQAAQTAVGEMTRTLGSALAQLACTLDPDVLLIGGGVSGAFSLFAPQLRAAYSQAAIPPCKGTEILPAQLGNRAGCAGAARQALTKALDAGRLSLRGEVPR